jgi:hypothetical protein
MSLIKYQADVRLVLLQRDGGSHVDGSTFGLGKWKLRDAPNRYNSFDGIVEWERAKPGLPNDMSP